MKINEGDKVGVISNGEIKKGVVISVYSDLDYAIVRFEDCSKKVMIHDIGLLPEEKDQDPKEIKEPVLKSEITIKREDFRKKAVKLIAREARRMDSGMVGIAFSMFVGDLERVLFTEGDND